MKLIPQWTVRTHVVLLVVIAVVPLVLFSGAVVYRSHQNQQLIIDDGIRATARALSLSLDREFTAAIQALQVLASSKALSRSNLSEFRAEMIDALAAYGPTWQNIVLADPTGQQLINLRLPSGAPLPRLDPALIEENLRTGKPSVSNVFGGPVSGAPSMVVSVPVLKDGQVKYLLRAGYSAAALSKFLAQNEIHPDWLMTILDRNQVIAARTREIEKYLGKSASPSFATRARQHREAFWRGRTLDGIDVVSALRRSDLSGWTVGVAIAASSVDAPLKDLLTLAGAAGLLALAAAMGLAALAGRRLKWGADQLVAAAQATGRGEIPGAAPLGIAELDTVAHELRHAAEKRQQAESDAKENHRRLETLIANLPGVAYRCRNDPNWTTEYVSAGMLSLTGHAPEEFMSHRIEMGDLIHTEDRDRVWETVQRGTASRGPYEMEYRIQTASGLVKWVWERGRGIYEDGNLVALEGFVTDITERRNAEAASREQLAELRRWFNSTVNREERMMGLKREVDELLGRLGQPPRYATSCDIQTKNGTLPFSR